MKYRPKEGIVLIHVCGEHLLVALRSVWPEVKMIRHLPKSTALCWDLFCKGMEEKKIVAFIASLSKRPIPEVEEKISLLWEEFFQAGYLEKVGEDEERQA